MKNHRNYKNLERKPTLVGLVEVIAVFTIIFSILALFDGTHRYFELLSHFKFQYLFASVLCAIIFAFLKKHALSSALLLVAALNTAFVAPWYFPVSEGALSEAPVSFTILHSNVYTGNINFEGFVDLVTRENPDVFVIQEVNKNWISAIHKLEDVYKHVHSVPREDNFGIAIFSKHPFESVETAMWGNSNIPSIVATITIQEQLVTVITTHPLPPISSDYYHSRNSQIDQIAKISRKEEGPLIIIGDLNITVWSDDYKPLELGTNLRNARKGFGILPTWPVKLPFLMIPIDHCLVSPHFVVDDIKVGENIGSDHLPLIVKLSLKK